MKQSRHLLQTSKKERATAVVGVVLVHAGVLAALLTLGGGPQKVIEAITPLEIFDVLPPPPPPPPPPPVVVETKAAPEEEGAAAPPAKKAEASPVVRPPPKVILVVPPPPVVAAEKPAAGSAPKAGAAPIDGPGSGAGGQGSGTGSGGSGTGPGGGGDGGASNRPSLVSRSLTQRDYSGGSRRGWPKGKRVLVTFAVELNGRASDCKVFTSSGVPAIDAETCRLVLTRLRFRPARDEAGRPVVARYAYMQYPLF